MDFPTADESRRFSKVGKIRKEDDALRKIRESILRARSDGEYRVVCRPDVYLRSDQIEYLESLGYEVIPDPVGFIRYEICWRGSSGTES